MGLFDFFNTKCDWKYDSGEIYTENTYGKFVIKDGRNNPFMGGGYEIVIHGGFTKLLLETNTLYPKGKEYLGRIFKFQEFEGYDQAKTTKGFLTFIAIPGDSIWDFLEELKKSSVLEIRYGMMPGVRGTTIFNIEGLAEGLKFFKSGYTKI